MESGAAGQSVKKEKPGGAQFQKPMVGTVCSEARMASLAFGPEDSEIWYMYERWVWK